MLRTICNCQFLNSRLKTCELRKHKHWYMIWYDLCTIVIFFNPQLHFFIRQDSKLLLYFILLFFLTLLPLIKKSVTPMCTCHSILISSLVRALVTSAVRTFVKCSMLPSEPGDQSWFGCWVSSLAQRRTSLFKWSQDECYWDRKVEEGGLPLMKQYLSS